MDGWNRGAARGGRWLTLLVALVAALATLEARADEPGLEELEARYEAASKDGRYTEAYEELRPEFRALADRRAGTDEGLGAELWLLRMHWWQREDGTMQSGAAKLARRLLEAYPENAQLKRIAEFDYLFAADDFEAICGDLARVTPHAEVKAWCLFSTGKKIGRDEPERAAPFFTAVRDKYGEIPFRATTFGAIASAYLDRHDPDKLAIGEVAPDIEGVDVNGQPMKLSDYRGKVVVLDFWGDW